MAALLAATIPIWMAIMQAARGEAPLTRRGISGLAVVFAGVGLLVAPAIGEPSISAGFFLAVLAMQLSAICWNAGTLYSRSRAAHSDPLARSVIQMLAAGLAVWLLALVTGERMTLG